MYKVENREKVFSVKLIDDNIKTTYDKENGGMKITQNITERMRLRYNAFEDIDNGSIYFVNKATGETELELSKSDE